MSLPFTALTPCTQANADISGMGVKLSIYFQAFLTVYHAHITLLLSGITFIPVMLAPVQHNPKSKTPLRFLLQQLVAWLHCTAVAAFGIWLWQDVRSFGNHQECTSQLFIVIIGFNVSMTSKALQIAALLFYGIFGFCSVLQAISILFRLYRDYQNTLSELRSSESSFVDLESQNHRLDLDSLDMNESLLREQTQEQGQLLQHSRSTALRPWPFRNTFPTRVVLDGVLEVRKHRHTCSTLLCTGLPADTNFDAQTHRPEDDWNSEVTTTGDSELEIERKQPEVQFLIVVPMLVIVGLEAILIACTEVLIQRSGGLVFPGESQWMSGQTGAACLAFIALISMIGQILGL